MSEAGNIFHWLRPIMTPIPGGSNWPERHQEQIDLVKTYNFDKFDNDPDHIGFVIRRTPPALHVQIKNRWDEGEAEEQLVHENAQAGNKNHYLQNVYKTIPPSLKWEHETGLGFNSYIKGCMQKHVEEWCGVELCEEAAISYGPRAYLTGSYLHWHVDRIATHAIGVILCVDSDLHREWPLTINDRADNNHQVNLEPGQMVMYESARLPHGRLQPLNGRYCVNMFLHYRPVDWTLDKSQLKLPYVNTPTYQIPVDAHDTTHDPNVR